MPVSHVFYHKSPLHANNYVLSFAFCFDKEDEVRDVIYYRQDEVRDVIYCRQDEVRDVIN